MRIFQERLPGMPPIDASAVSAAITKGGAWERHEEWRISTVTATSIRTTGEPKHRAYAVRVECDFVLEAHCPTLARSIEVAAYYERLVQQIWREIGWPSWAAIDQLEPSVDAV